MKRATFFVAVAVLLLAACGAPSRDALLDRLDDRFGCADVRLVEDTTAVCELADGRAITISTGLDSEAVVEFFIALSKDDGHEGPWIVGDGFVLFPVPGGDLNFAAEIRTATGGELRF